MSAAADIRHLGRHDRHGENVDVERQPGHRDHGVGDVARVHRRLGRGEFQPDGCGRCGPLLEQELFVLLIAKMKMLNIRLKLLLMHSRSVLVLLGCIAILLNIKILIFL